MKQETLKEAAEDYSGCNEHKMDLIAVDEVLWSLNDIDGEENTGNFIHWWEEVKQEIEKL